MTTSTKIRRITRAAMAALSLASCASFEIPEEQLKQPVIDWRDVQDRAVGDYIKDVSKKMAKLISSGRMEAPYVWGEAREQGGMAEVEVRLYGGRPVTKLIRQKGGDVFGREGLALVDVAAHRAWKDDSLYTQNFSFTMSVTYQYDGKGPMVLTSVY